MDTVREDETVTRLPASRLAGRTLRFAWTEGPTKGKVHEHRFHVDGTVEWRGIDPQHPEVHRTSSAKPERPPYFAADLRDDCSFVSYLSASGYALSIVLDFRDFAIVGVASDGRHWHPVKGRLEGAA